MDEINQVDLAFCVDTTGSMGSFILAAQKQLIETIKALSSAAGINLQVGLVEYRDHPPQENTFVTKVHKLTADLGEIQKVINGLTPTGGGDGPEAVYQGLWDTCAKLDWRKHSYKFSILVGDSPPHAFAAWAAENAPWRRSLLVSDGFPKACPSGFDPFKIAAKAEEVGVTVHAMVLGGASVTTQAFEEITGRAGGQTYQSTDGRKVIEAIAKTIGTELEKLDFDRKVFEMVREQVASGRTYHEAATYTSETLGASTADSLVRLSSRGILLRE